MHCVVHCVSALRGADSQSDTSRTKGSNTNLGRLQVCPGPIRSLDLLFEARWRGALCDPLAQPPAIPPAARPLRSTLAATVSVPLVTACSVTTTIATTVATIGVTLNDVVATDPVVVSIHFTPVASNQTAAIGNRVELGEAENCAAAPTIARW